MWIISALLKVLQVDLSVNSDTFANKTKGMNELCKNKT